jgi:hypothetical protein
MKKIKKQKQKKKVKYRLKKELKRFDLVLKEIFSRAVGKIISIATGEKIKEKLEDINREVKLLKSLRPDMLFKAGDKIFHIEIQAQQDKTLPKRMLLYSVGIEEKFGKELFRLFCFVGKGNPPPSYIRSEFKFLKFRVVDWKKIKPDEFLKSEKPEEVVLEFSWKIQRKTRGIQKSDKKDFKNCQKQKRTFKIYGRHKFLGSLFDVEIKVEPMPIQIDIRKTLFYKWGEQKGFEKGRKRFKGGKKRNCKRSKQGKKEVLKKVSKKGFWASFK